MNVPKYFPHGLLLLITLSFSFYSSAQTKSIKPVFVLVHGAWGGSWAFKKVDSLMTEKSAIVYRPSLTGMGERSHLSNANIGLQTHINDVINLILFEDLHDVILVGHSYGGMVVTGVADSIGERISKLIYTDAFVPENGESVFTIAKSAIDFVKKNTVDGLIIPAWQNEGTPIPRDVPQPLKTFTDQIVLKNSSRQIPTMYILTVEKGKAAKDDDFASQAERAKKKGWTVLELESDHNPQRSAPELLARILLENK